MNTSESTVQEIECFDQSGSSPPSPSDNHRVHPKFKWHPSAQPSRVGRPETMQRGAGIPGRRVGAVSSRPRCCSTRRRPRRDGQTCLQDKTVVRTARRRSQYSHSPAGPEELDGRRNAHPAEGLSVSPADAGGRVEPCPSESSASARAARAVPGANTRGGSMSPTTAGVIECPSMTSPRPGAARFPSYRRKNARKSGSQSSATKSQRAVTPDRPTCPIRR